MKIYIFFILAFFALKANGQSSEVAFHGAANSYIQGNFQQAKMQIEEALKKYPNDPKLNSLYEKVKKEEQKQPQNKDEKNKEKNKEEKKDGQQGEEKQDDQQNQDKKEADEKKNEGDPKERSEGQEPNESDDKKNNEENELSTLQRLKEMNMSEEKAKMILEAMKNSEIQYLQQNKRKSGKPTNSNKPDW